ncbi:CBS domain containing protein [Oleidesulfovibrio alaskensis G20]|uniref:CBS domain containing protein n=1 Tax=Oleidesulfovibrio alaskensis (strain ATCC BAA-1058 / DSM 17464 / G20) TaxID=207559 RepID=Q310P2_OLEA2|nr:hemolysin family protein [Oleidesulfovibrio alaskensis]ABB38604.2 CBS domain containing protein [Oleidesulfovibrio alaskensis G20]MBG0773913.1 HlyC/CorC family transporter [Oleidesulfovibrio alaskensis]
MDGGSDSRLWSLFSRFFSAKNGDSVEQAIIEAQDDGELDSEESTMLLSILRLDEMQVYEIMTPRTDIDCADDQSSLGDIIDLIVSSGHSRIPVYRDNRDNIIGVVYAKDLLSVLTDTGQRSAPVTETMRQPIFVPETKKVSELLQEFRTRKNHLAIALDEYGGTSGLVTIEDVLEVIVGDIEDEHDAPRQEDIRALDDGTLEVSGRAFLEDLSERLGVLLESDQVETIGGYLSEIAGHVPQAGESFTVGAHSYTVMEADAKQIKTIRVTPSE